MNAALKKSNDQLIALLDWAYKAYCESSCLWFRRRALRSRVVEIMIALNSVDLDDITKAHLDGYLDGIRMIDHRLYDDIMMVFHNNVAVTDGDHRKTNAAIFGLLIQTYIRIDLITYKDDENFMMRCVRTLKKADLDVETSAMLTSFMNRLLPVEPVLHFEADKILHQGG